MILDVARNAEVSELRRNIYEIMSNEEYFSQWIEHPSSSIVHHENHCCEEARMWFLAFARSQEARSPSQYGLKAPVWLSELFSWGPSQWPISWCRLVQEEVIDCGVFAALAREVFKAQGHEPHPAQALLHYNPECTNHWKDLWKKAPVEKKSRQKSPPNLEEKKLEEKQIKKAENHTPGTTFPWIGNEIVYHELCVIETLDGSAKVYDSTWGNWYEPHQRFGFGAVIAIRMECPRLLRWGNKTIGFGEWTDL